MKKGTGTGASTELGQSSSAMSARESRKPPPEGANVQCVIEYTVKKFNNLARLYELVRLYKFTFCNLLKYF